MKIKNMEVVEDFESKSLKAVTFLVERYEKIQEVRYVARQQQCGSGGTKKRRSMKGDKW